MCGSAEITPRPAARCRNAVCSSPAARIRARISASGITRQPERLQPVPQIGTHPVPRKPPEIHNRCIRANHPRQVRLQLPDTRTLPPPQLVCDLPEHPLCPPPGHPANHGPAEQVQPAGHPSSHRGRLISELAARAGHYPAHGRYLPPGRGPGRCPANIRRPWPGAACPRRCRHRTPARTRSAEAGKRRSIPARGSSRTTASGPGSRPRSLYP
jgi:hypothetical protein